MLSLVAGIVKPDGGLRVIVGSLRSIQANTGPREKLFFVPGLAVEEPVPWGKAQADLIDTVQRHVLKQLAPKNDCGECRQCCKTLYINEDGLTKPSHQWCRNCDQSVGCKVYWKRPKPCRTFACLWLKSQSTAAPMAAELRPDRCHVVLTSDTSAAIGETPDPQLIEVHVDREDQEAMYREPIVSFLALRKTKRITFYYGEQT